MESGMPRSEPPWSRKPQGWSCPSLSRTSSITPAIVWRPTLTQSLTGQPAASGRQCHSTQRRHHHHGTLPRHTCHKLGRSTRTAATKMPLPPLPSTSQPSPKPTSPPFSDPRAPSLCADDASSQSTLFLTTQPVISS